MRSIRWITGPIILGTLLATTPQLALGQDTEGKPVLVVKDLRPGTEVRGRQLGELLAKTLRAELATDMRPLSVRLNLEVVSREEGIIDEQKGGEVKIEPGKTYVGSELNPNLGLWAPKAFQEEVLTLYPAPQVFSPRQGMPRECEEATHAVRISLVPGNERAKEQLGEVKLTTFLCLDVKG